MVRRKSKQKVDALYSDYGPPERAQHGPVVIEFVPKDMQDTTRRNRARAVETDDPLYRLRRQGSITGRQRAAGMALRALWNRTGLEPRTISRYSDMIAAGSVENLNIKSIDHYQRFLTALRLLTPNVARAIVSVVCLQERVTGRRVEHVKHGLTKLQRFFGT